jgi:hypothetical protein
MAKGNRYRKVSLAALMTSLFAVVFLSLAIRACGNDSAVPLVSSKHSNREPRTITDEAEPGASAFDVRLAKRELRSVVFALADRRTACDQLSDRFLAKNYGAPGVKGQHKCEMETRKLPSRTVRSIQFLSVRPRFAWVLLVDSGGAETKLKFVVVGHQWFLDHALSA